MIVGAVYSDVKFITMAPNANNDLLIAGDYVDGFCEEQSFVFFFEETTCSIKWKFRGGDSIRFPRALSWGYDQSKAYMISTDESISARYEYLTVFRDPYDIFSPFGTPSPKTYRMEIQNTLNEIQYINGMLPLPGGANDDRMLVTRFLTVSVLRFGPNYHLNLENRYDKNWKIMTVDVDSTTGDFWIMQRGLFSPVEGYLALRKFSSTQFAQSLDR